MKFDVGIWGTVAEWVSGIGTMIAVSVALWLGTRKPPELLTWDVHYGGAGGNPALYLTIRNTGMIEVLITRAVLNQRGVFSYPHPADLPRPLAPGHEATLSFAVGGRTPRESVAPWLSFQTGRGKVFVVNLPPEVASELEA